MKIPIKLSPPITSSSEIVSVECGLYGFESLIELASFEENIDFSKCPRNCIFKFLLFMFTKTKIKLKNTIE